MWKWTTARRAATGTKAPKSGPASPAAGYNIYAEHINTPALLELLPDIRGLDGVDIGCGEGAHSRLLAPRCASIVSLDIAPTFLRYAREAAPAIACVQASGAAVSVRGCRLRFRAREHEPDGHAEARGSPSAKLPAC